MGKLVRAKSEPGFCEMTQGLTQGTDEWARARAGSLGASQIHEALAKTKGGWSASRGSLLARLAVERLTGVPVATFTNAAMAHGTATEPVARDTYAFVHDVTVAQIGMALHPEIKGTHASPDGLVGNDGLLEIKCPQHQQHLATLLGEPIKQAYIFQMQWQMRCCDREWCDFVSFQPDFPAEMQMWVHRVPRDDKLIAQIEAEVTAFLAELDETIAALRGAYKEDA